MNYCSIQEAWGPNNRISNQYQNFDKPEIEKKSIEKFSNTEKKISNNRKTENRRREVNNKIPEIENEYIEDFNQDINKPYQDINKSYQDINKPYQNIYKPYQNINKPKQNINKRSQMSHYKCHDLIVHLKTCRECQLKMRNQYRSKVLDNVEDVIQTNRDMIVLILVGICLIIFFNLISNINS